MVASATIRGGESESLSWRCGAHLHTVGGEGTSVSPPPSERIGRHCGLGPTATATASASAAIAASAATTVALIAVAASAATTIAAAAVAASAGPASSSAPPMTALSVAP